MSLHQSLQQKFSQKLLPQQIQLMKFLQVPTAFLPEKIKEELEENPALELTNKDSEADELQRINDDDFQQEEDWEEEKTMDEGLDMTELYAEDDVPDYKMKDENYPDINQQDWQPAQNHISFFEFMVNQLALLSLDEEQYKIAEYIIGSLEEDGYLRRDALNIVDDLAFNRNIITSIEEVNHLIEQIQQLDLPGVAAKNLQECLLLQAKRLVDTNPIYPIVVEILSEYFEPFSKKQYEKIQDSLRIDDATLQACVQLILKLNPRPGRAISPDETAENFIIPDFYILNMDEKIEISLNSINAPDLKISEGYIEMLKEYGNKAKTDKKQKEAVGFIKQKVEKAKWFIDMIQQRQATLNKCMRAIVEKQEEFFTTGDESTLKPMILKDVAQKTGLDVSTISRVVNSKYAQTPFGTFSLKHFFNEGLTTTAGEEISFREVKKILEEEIKKENPTNPFSDEQLTQILLKKGFPVARRTVAKYREELSIGTARTRKKGKLN